MRKVVTCIEILLLFFLQTTIFPKLTFLSVVPNLLLILTVVNGFVNGKKSGLFTGFFCGLLIDIFYSNLFGFYALVYMYIGYLNGLLYNIYYDDDVKVPMVLVAVSDLVYGCLIYGTQFLLRGRIHFFYYLQHIIIPEVVLTTLITLLLYRIYYVLSQKVSDSREGDKDLPWLGK